VIKAIYDLMDRSQKISKNYQRDSRENENFKHRCSRPIYQPFAFSSEKVITLLLQTPPIKLKYKKQP